VLQSITGPIRRSRSPASDLKKDSACAAVHIAAARRLLTGRVEEVLPSRFDSFDSEHMDRHPQPYAREADFAVSSVIGRSMETGRCAAGKKEVSP